METISKQILRNLKLDNKSKKLNFSQNLQVDAQDLVIDDRDPQVEALKLKLMLTSGLI